MCCPQVLSIVFLNYTYVICLERTRRIHNYICICNDIRINVKYVLCETISAFFNVLKVRFMFMIYLIKTLKKLL